MYLRSSTCPEISIHALREESDDVDSTQTQDQPISIHALREESDPACGHQRPSRPHFNPRSP